MNKNNEMKIGIFVVAGLFLLIFGWAFLREISLEKQFKFVAVFDDVSGLIKGSFVRINGLRIGRVDKLTLDTKKRKVFVEARIQLPEITVPVDSMVFIRTSGYVGDKYLDIELGMSSKILKEGETIAGEPVFDSTKSIERVSKILNEIDAKQISHNIQDFTSDAAKLVKKAGATSDEVSQALNQRFILPKLFFGKLTNSKQKKEQLETIEGSKD